MIPNYYLALVHHPIKNKRGEIVTTSVTNLDIHDISRTAKTFGFKGYFIVTPILKQQELVGRILGHWESDKGNIYNPDRSDAMQETRVISSIDECIKEITSIENGIKPLIVVTTALQCDFDGDMKALVHKLRVDNRPMLLLFGTGWGMTDELMARADFRLEPIWGEDNGYNHLSVRSAVAIYADRFLIAKENQGPN